MKNFFKVFSVIGVTMLTTGCAVYPTPQYYDTHIHSANGYQGRSVQPVQVISNVQQPQVYVDSIGNRYVNQNGNYAQITPSPRQYQPDYYNQYPQQYVKPVYQQQYSQPSYQQPQYQNPSYQQNRATPNTGGAVVGGVVGGLAGSMVGKGNGNLAATAIGAGTGAVVGAGCRTVNGGQVLGGVVGGLLGSRVGKGSGRTIATAIGAGTGALVGNDMSGGCLR